MKKIKLSEMKIDELKKFHKDINSGIYDVLSAKQSVNHKKVFRKHISINGKKGSNKMGKYYIMKKNKYIIILIIILLVGCGRKGDLLPPPTLNADTLNFANEGISHVFIQE